jgi:orotate phosphoribosyltransferase-like protein
MLTAGGTLNVFESEACASVVIIVESATVTGRKVLEVADRLRQDGAQMVVAAVMHRARPDLDQLENDPAIDRVIELVAG